MYTAKIWQWLHIFTAESWGVEAGGRKKEKNWDLGELWKTLAIISLNVKYSFWFASLPCEDIVKDYLKAVCGDMSYNPSTGEATAGGLQENSDRIQAVCLDQKHFETIC